MDVKIRQDRQDDRTRILETLIRSEGHLDSRMYACSDYLVSNGTTEHNDILERRDFCRKLLHKLNVHSVDVTVESL